MKRILLVLLSVLVVCAFSACSSGEETVGKVEISCGGEGFGPSTHYYGIVYSVADHYNAVFGSEFPLEEFKASG